MYIIDIQNKNWVQFCYWNVLKMSLCVCRNCRVEKKGNKPNISPENLQIKTLTSHLLTCEKYVVDDLPVLLK